MTYQQAYILKKISLFFLILSLGLTSASSTHAEAYTYVTKWSPYVTIGGYYWVPHGIAVDSAGYVYVPDSDNQIKKFDSNGNYLATWGAWRIGSSEDGKFDNPYGVAVDSSGNVYVADTDNYRIQKLNNSGGFLAKWGNLSIFNWPQGVTVDFSGDVYVADTFHHRIQKFTSSDGRNYTFVTYVGDKQSAAACSQGTGNGQFKWPNGVAVDSVGNVYVADTGNNRIQKFASSDGNNYTFVTYVGDSQSAAACSPGSGDGQFINPKGVDVDSSGNVYVADTENHRIQKFASSGLYITKWGSYGTSDGQLISPYGVAADASDYYVYVADTNNHRIQKFVPALEGTDLHLSKQAPDSISYGNSMTYTLYYSNFGNKSAHNVVLDDILPDNVTFVSASEGGIYTSSTRTVRWDIGAVGPISHGYRTLNVSIPPYVPAGTVIINNANINTSDLEVRYDDNEAQAQTKVTGSILPPNVGVVPNNGGIGTPSVFWMKPIIISYHSCDFATAVDIKIHFNDGTPDIVGNMAGGPPDWNYTVTFYPQHHGNANVTYTIYGCDVQNVSFSIYVDPAGYIYDVDTGHRIANATVSLQRPDGKGDWVNVPTGQKPAIAQPDINTLISDSDGGYQWDVLNGTYRVHVEAPGYKPADSIMVTVPPPVTDLHVGLHHINVPPIADAGGPYIGTAGVVVRLNGSRSYDPDADWNDSIFLMIGTWIEMGHSMTLQEQL